MRSFLHRFLLVLWSCVVLLVSGACAPSRTTIITGVHQSSISTRHMRTKHRGPGLPTPYAVVPPLYVKTFTVEAP